MPLHFNYLFGELANAASKTVATTTAPHKHTQTQRPNSICPLFGCAIRAVSKYEPLAGGGGGGGDRVRRTVRVEEVLDLSDVRLLLMYANLLRLYVCIL